MTSRLPVVLLLILVAAGCSSANDAETADLSQTSAADAEDEPAPPDAAPGEDADEGAGDDAGVGAGQPVSVEDLPETVAGDRVIKEGTVTLALEAGSFDRAFAQVVDVAARLGGNVVSSTTASTDAGAVSGNVTVRVPVERYEQLLVGVGEIGEVRARDVTAQDVTGEYVDLESRLRHLEAQERFYLELLAEADGVSDAIAVQQQLTAIQAQVEQIRGRLQLLDSRTTFSTLTVELFEPDAPPGLALTAPREQPTFAHWWTVARAAFVNVIGVMLVVAFFVGPLLVLAAVGWVAWRATRRSPVAAAQP